MNSRHELLHDVSGRLLKALVWLLVILIGILLLGSFSEKLFGLTGILAVTPFVAFVVGAIGGFVSFQRRLKDLEEDDLMLIAKSAMYSFLAPVVGGILAVLLYIIFLSGLLAGDLFPVFVADKKPAPIGFECIFATHGTFQDYSKLVFWCFVAGFSERFVTSILSQFEGQVPGRNETPDGNGEGRLEGKQEKGGE